MSLLKFGHSGGVLLIINLKFEIRSEFVYLSDPWKKGNFLVILRFGKKHYCVITDILFKGRFFRNGVRFFEHKLPKNVKMNSQKQRKSFVLSEMLSSEVSEEVQIISNQSMKGKPWGHKKSRCFLKMGKSGCHSSHFYIKWVAREGAIN